MFIRIEKESLERYGRSEALAKRILDLAKLGADGHFKVTGRPRQIRNPSRESE